MGDCILLVLQVQWEEVMHAVGTCGACDTYLRLKYCPCSRCDYRVGVYTREPFLLTSEISEMILHGAADLTANGIRKVVFIWLSEPLKQKQGWIFHRKVLTANSSAPTAVAFVTCRWKNKSTELTVFRIPSITGGNTAG